RRPPDADAGRGRAARGVLRAGDERRDRAREQGRRRRDDRGRGPRARRRGLRADPAARAPDERLAADRLLPPPSRPLEVVGLGEDGYFDEAVAARYDDSESEMFDPALVEATVDFLAGLAGSGRALELGIGTGRIAVPLAQRGVPVHGIDMSRAMVARLREKPGAERIGVTIGDFAKTTVDGAFSLAYLVFNTINNLTTQDAQVACFRNVAAHLEPGGCFVIEVGVGGGEPLRVFDLTDTHVGIDEYEAATQRLVSHHIN